MRAHIIDRIGAGSFGKNGEGQQIFYWGKRRYIIDGEQRKKLHTLLKIYLLLPLFLLVSGVVIGKLLIAPLTSQLIFITLYFCIPCSFMQAFIHIRTRTLPRSPNMLSLVERYQIAAHNFPAEILYGFTAVLILIVTIGLMRYDKTPTSFLGILLVGIPTLVSIHMCRVQYLLRKKC